MVLDQMLYLLTVENMQKAPKKIDPIFAHMNLLLPAIKASNDSKYLILFLFINQDVKSSLKINNSVYILIKKNYKCDIFINKKKQQNIKSKELHVSLETYIYINIRLFFLFS